MISAAKRGNVLLTAVLAAVSSVVGAGRAEAQWGIGFGGMGGFGLGYGFGLGGGYVQQPANYLNQVSLARMNHIRGPIQNDVYANHPNAYYNHLRDSGFVDRYYPDRRDPAYYGHSSRARGHRVTPTSAKDAAPSARPIVPLGTFFNDRSQLVWPGDAPTTGELQAKREAVDQACAVALAELKKNGSASVASATEARQKLLDYGRPALAALKANEPRVADGFRTFLLSLYDSLAQAAIR